MMNRTCLPAFLAANKACSILVGCAAGLAGLEGCRLRSGGLATEASTDVDILGTFAFVSGVAVGEKLGGAAVAPRPFPSSEDRQSNEDRGSSQEAS